jgi:hypothetical protein
MNMPGFTAEKSLRAPYGLYRSGPAVDAQPSGVIPSIPRCQNCPDLLEYCATHGGKPRAACLACATGNCNSGQERCEFDPIRNKVVCF